MSLSPDYICGVLDACAVFHAGYSRPRLVLSIPDAELRQRVQSKWGGHLIGKRVVIESPNKLRDLLRDWLKITRTRRDDIRRMQMALGDAGADLSLDSSAAGL